MFIAWSLGDLRESSHFMRLTEAVEGSSAPGQGLEPRVALLPSHQADWGLVWGRGRADIGSPPSLGHRNQAAMAYHSFLVEPISCHAWNKDRTRECPLPAE